MGADIDGEAAEDRSGRSVSLSNDGTVVAIGAPRNDANGSSSGHVRIIAWNSTSWVQRGNDLDGEASIDQSGTSVSLNNDGTVVAIGANGNDENGPYSGHVRIYAWDSPTKSWDQKGNDLDGDATYDRSGDSVSLSNDGTVVAIGAGGNDGVNGFNSGHVRIYAWDSTSWVRRGNDIDGEAAWDYSGRSVSLSNDGTVVAIGAPYNDGVNGSESGHVRIYTWDSTSWVQRGNDIDGEAYDDYSSDSLSLSNDGTVVAIGAGNNDENGSMSGHVRIYAWDSTSWIQRGADIDGVEVATGDNYFMARTKSVSLSNDGTVVAIGAGGKDGINGNYSAGHVRVYTWDSTSWVQRGNDLEGEAAGDYSGESVSLNNDGTVVAIGAVGNDENGSMSGHVRVYSFGLPVEPSPLPSDEPSPLPSDEPIMPTETPSVSQLPSTTPSESAQPSETPSVSQLPTATPSVSAKPSAMPSTAPSLSAQPSETPSVSQMPSETPSVSQLPSETPSVSSQPSALPSTAPSESAQPSETPSVSQKPSEIPSVSQLPSETPSVSQLPSAMPSTTPSKSAQPSETPSVSQFPSETPSVSQLPSAIPSTAPSESAQPSETPSVSQLPSETPSVSTQPSVMPSAMPSVTPSVSQLPSETPSVSAQPSETSKPSVSPSDEPSVLPSDKPSVLPSNKPNVLSSNQRSSAVKAVGATSIALVLVMLSLV
jgi:co-chaperonin GroES (HSP10)